jgi:hypothetical protein
MSWPGDNFVVPGANPNNVPGGVESVIAGTNITVTGTAINPIVNSSAQNGVTQLEGLTGNLNLNGVGMTIVGGTPTANDILLTTTVQNVTAGGGITVTPTSGTYQVSATVQNVTGVGGVTVTNPSPGVYQIANPIPTNFTISDYLGLAGTNNSAGPGLTIGPGLTAWYTTFPSVNFATYCAARSKLIVTAGILYQGSATLVPNELSYGLVWGTPGIAPGVPANPTSNSNTNTSVDSGIIATAVLNTGDVLTPGANTALYFAVSNLNTTTTTIQVTELPAYFLLTFI